jgi:transcriptional regulator with XRE-family HTH domain
MSLFDPTIDDRLGTRIRDLRSARSLTLDNLAQRADVSRAMLSRVERGESSPTAQWLVKICGGLGVTLSTLFADAETPAHPLARRAEQPVWRDPATGYVRRTVSPPATGSPVDLVEVIFPAGGDVTLDGMALPDGDQHVWVLDGTLDVLLGDDLYRLEVGDCLRMRFDRPIRFANRTVSPIRYAVVVSRGGVRP